jgi:hypothetical protein
MRVIYAHDAVVEMSPASDPRAIGAAITVSLCGDWQHEPPCPMAPHHTRTESGAREVRVRTLFAAEPTLERAVRRRIDEALDVGRVQMPEGQTAEWKVLTSQPGVVREDEREHGDRLIRS